MYYCINTYTWRVRGVLYSRKDRSRKYREIKTLTSKRWFTVVHYRDLFLSLVGNEYIHLLTLNRPSELYFKLQGVNGTWYHALYANFTIGPETDGYRFYCDVNSYTGNAGTYY